MGSPDQTEFTNLGIEVSRIIRASKSRQNYPISFTRDGAEAWDQQVIPELNRAVRSLDDTGFAPPFSGQMPESAYPGSSMEEKTAFNSGVKETILYARWASEPEDFALQERLVAAFGIEKAGTPATVEHQKYAFESEVVNETTGIEELRPELKNAHQRGVVAATVWKFIKK